MPKTKPTASLVLNSRPPGATLFRWLYDEIRTAIVEGRLAPGTRLPSTRSIADQHHVARGTVVAAFEQLATEGYVESGVGDGTFVRRMIAEPRAEAKLAQRHGRGKSSRPSLSLRGQELAGHPFPPLWSKRGVETFQLDRPALDAFPIKLWSRIAARRLRGAVPGLLTGCQVFGYRPLREVIADYVGLKRGVKCTADEVVITSGTQQSLDLVARLVLDRGDRVWMEDPGYAAVTSLLRAHAAQVIGVPVDAEGIDCDAGRRRGRVARLVYVTPGCQFPLGNTLSLQRRLALLRWAHEQGAWIFEDDYDSQLQFSGRPLAALRSLDSGGHVVYSNTFNKMLFTSLRLGFIVLPPGLVAATGAARSIVDRFPSVLDQATLCDFIAEGHMDQHMRRMRELYETRLAALLRAAERDLDGVMQLTPATSGLQVVGWLAKDIDEREACRRAAAQDINTVPLSMLTIERSMPPGLLLGVASADTRAISRAVARLGNALRELKSERGTRNGPSFP
jgi:GntR family transcriptional regulator / MocR family aminotransferase